MSSAPALLNCARSQLGVKENPPNSNMVLYSKWYPMPGQPWCGMFVSWCADQIGATDVIPKYAYTPDGAQWFKDRGQWFTQPQVGDIVFFQWATSNRICHTGIVETVNSNGSINAIEGNTDESGGGSGGKVMRQSRRSYIVGYGRPTYTTDDPEDDVTSYYCEVAQNTGQGIDPTGEDIRWQQENDDDHKWHTGSYPGVFPTLKIGGNATASVELDGAGLVELRVYTSKGDKLKTFGRHTSHGAGYVNVAGYCKVSKGQYLCLWVKPTGSAPITARYGVLAIAAREL
jgi:surface antigen